MNQLIKQSGDLLEAAETIGANLSMREYSELIVPIRNAHQANQELARQAANIPEESGAYARCIAENVEWMASQLSRVTSAQFTHRSTNTPETDMTIEQRKLAQEGQGFWAVYVEINGYAFYPTRAGLAKLARNLDLTVPYISKRITAYLEA